jgi:translation initiation factor 4E
LFKKGIRPEWEDKDNVGGCDLVTVKQIYGEVDTFWQNLVLALIGETIEDDNEICGARVLEKMRRDKAGPGKNYYRIEVWMRAAPPDVIHRVKGRLPEVLAVDMGRNKLPLAEFDVKYRDKK